MWKDYWENNKTIEKYKRVRRTGAEQDSRIREKERKRENDKKKGKMNERKRDIKQLNNKRKV